MSASFGLRYSVDVKRSSILWLAVAVAVFAAVVVMANIPGVDSWFGGESSSSVDNSASENGSPSGGQEQQALVAIDRPDDATLSHIAYVYDGDTLYLQPDGTSSREDEVKVRLIGIDSPELRPEVQCYGIEARDYLRNLLPEGTQVWIMRDREPLDQYGRSLLYLWTTDDRSVNLDLVKKGYATALNIAPSNTYWKIFDTAEAQARKADAGQWGAC